jgi:hypothetical protein
MRLVRRLRSTIPLNMRGSHGGLGVIVNRMIVTVLEIIITYLVSASNQEKPRSLYFSSLLLLQFQRPRSGGARGREGHGRLVVPASASLSNHGTITSREQISLFPPHHHQAYQDPKPERRMRQGLPGLQ